MSQSGKPFAPGTLPPEEGKGLSLDGPDGHRQAQGVIERLREELARAKERERLLAQELQHRVRNMLAVIRSILRRTRDSGASQDEFADHFQGRLDAVARHYTQTDTSGSFAVELEDMLRSELLEARCLDGPNCVLEGPPVLLPQATAELMVLAIHELVTNAIKFGALGRGGKLAVRWLPQAGPGGAALHFLWRESGVPLVASAPRPSGFGRQLIEVALPYQLGATTSFELKPGGIECTILLPLGKPGDQVAGLGADGIEADAPLLPSDKDLPGG